ncbi:hypothetical protein PR048_003527 [Dryococelus australis]|uniref:Uncharacterized protein n=1 Tax=Dryococelus australis TaxID=614101 RepID=A0ABQ9INB2_9NEOP|nr:hypothetical protein PR048_003527 [Dryococelus australis]
MDGQRPRQETRNTNQELANSSNWDGTTADSNTNAERTEMLLIYGKSEGMQESFAGSNNNVTPTVFTQPTPCLQYWRDVKATRGTATKSGRRNGEVLGHSSNEAKVVTVGAQEKSTKPLLRACPGLCPLARKRAELSWSLKPCVCVCVCVWQSRGNVPLGCWDFCALRSRVDRRARPIPTPSRHAQSTDRHGRVEVAKGKVDRQETFIPFPSTHHHSLTNSFPLLFSPLALSLPPPQTARGSQHLSEINPPSTGLPLRLTHMHARTHVPPSPPPPAPLLPFLIRDVPVAARGIRLGWRPASPAERALEKTPQPRAELMWTRPGHAACLDSDQAYIPNDTEESSDVATKSLITVYAKPPTPIPLCPAPLFARVVERCI